MRDLAPAPPRPLPPSAYVCCLPPPKNSRNRHGTHSNRPDKVFEIGPAIVPITPAPVGIGRVAESFHAPLKEGVSLCFTKSTSSVAMNGVG